MSIPHSTSYCTVEHSGQLLQGRNTSVVAKPVYRDIDNLSARFDARRGICHRQTELVVAVKGDLGLMADIVSDKPYGKIE